jgi:SPOR domain
MSYINLGMMNRKLKIQFLSIFIFGSILLGGCSSGEYELNSYRYDYEEVIINADTIRNVAIKEDNTKEDKIKEDKFLTRDSYNFSVQIGAFLNPDFFARFLSAAKARLGDDVYYDLIGNMYRVRIGAFTNRAETMRFIEFVKSKGYFDAFIITKKK